MAELDQPDVAYTKAVNRLNELGYEQELERGLSFLGILGLGVGLVCLPYTIYLVSAIVFTEGGSVDFLYGWALWGLLTIPVVLSMGEICSVFPVAAGTYYWCYALAPRRQKRLASYINGFLISIGLILAVLATAFPMGQVLATAVVIFHPDYIIPTWLPYVIFLVTLASSIILCSLGTMFLDRFSLVGGLWVPVVTVVLFILPLAMGKERHSIRFVLTNFQSYSGWSPAASFLIGLLGPGGILTGFGFLTSLCEEVSDPAVTVPRAMLTTQVIGVVSGIVFLFGTLVTVPDGLDIATAQLGQAGYVIFEAVMDTPGGALAMLLISTSTAVFLLVGTLTAGSRFVWAFARDGGLPGSKWLSIVHPRLKIPLNAMVVICVADALLGLISFGSTVAYGAFLGGCTIMLLIAYCQPIVYSLISHRESIKGAPWSLGRWGWSMNITSIATSILGCVLFSWPLTTPVTILTMNWSVVLALGFLILGLVYYWVYGHKSFRGPATADNEAAIPDVGGSEKGGDSILAKVLAVED